MWTSVGTSVSSVRGNYLNKEIYYLVCGGRIGRCHAITTPYMRIYYSIYTGIHIYNTSRPSIIAVIVDERYQDMLIHRYIYISKPNSVRYGIQ